MLLGLLLLGFARVRFHGRLDVASLRHTECSPRPHLLGRTGRFAMSRSQAAKLGVLTAVAVLVLLLATAASISVTWDEPIYSQAAENAARWFGVLPHGGPRAAFAQTAFGVGWGLVNEHPPLVRVLNGLGWALTHGLPPGADRASRREHAARCAHYRRVGDGNGAALRAGRRPVCRGRGRDDAARLLPPPSRRAGFRPRGNLVPGYAGVLLCLRLPGGGGRRCWPGWGSAWRC